MSVGRLYSMQGIPLPTGDSSAKTSCQRICSLNQILRWNGGDRVKEQVPAFARRMSRVSALCKMTVARLRVVMHPPTLDSAEWFEQIVSRSISSQYLADLRFPHAAQESPCRPPSRRDPVHAMWTWLTPTLLLSSPPLVSPTSS